MQLRCREQNPLQTNGAEHKCSTYLLGINGVTQRLAHLVPLLIEHEAMSQHGLIRSLPVGRHRSQKTRLEPPTMLIRPWSKAISGPPHVAAIPRSEAYVEENISFA